MWLARNVRTGASVSHLRVPKSQRREGFGSYQLAARPCYEDIDLMKLLSYHLK